MRLKKQEIFEYVKFRAATYRSIAVGFAAVAVALILHMVVEANFSWFKFCVAVLCLVVARSIVGFAAALLYNKETGKGNKEKEVGR